MYYKKNSYIYIYPYTEGQSTIGEARVGRGPVCSLFHGAGWLLMAPGSCLTGYCPVKSACPWNTAVCGGRQKVLEQGGDPWG